MRADIQSILKEKEPSKEHTDLLSRLKSLVDTSRSRMSGYYDTWDRHDDVYRNIKPDGADRSDKKAEERKEPTKMVVPIAHSQIQTFVAFCYAVYFQREYFYELTPMGADASKAADIGEVLIQRDLDHSNFRGTIYQHLLDIARFGIGVLKDSWVEETKWVTQVAPPKEVKIPFFNKSFPYGGGQTSKVKVPAYQGNKVTNVSPYRFFPDPSLPIERFQEGEFVAFEDEYTYSTLKTMEANGVVAGIEFIPNMTDEYASNGRKLTRFAAVRIMKDVGNQPFAKDNEGAICITEVIWNCVPSMVPFGDGKLGDETEPCKYLVWIANDARIIRIEKFDYDHDTFPCSVGQFSPDLHHFINDGLSGTIDVLQDVISWFVNSHITSVRKVIQNLIVVDPQTIELDDLRERRPVIRIKPGANRLGVDKYISQLNLQDVTANHMEDARVLQQMVQITTGISDAALGQFYTGRRSATEAKDVATGTSSRLKMHAALIYYASLEPLGRRMLSNLRQGLTIKTYVKIVGIQQDPQMEGYMQFAQVDKSDLQGDLDFEILDGTLPSEKQYQAQTIGETLQALLAMPQLVMLTGLDIKKMVFEQLKLRGIRHPERLQMDQVQMQQIQQALMMQQQQQQQPSNATQPANPLQQPGASGATQGA